MKKLLRAAAFSACMFLAACQHRHNLTSSAPLIESAATPSVDSIEYFNSQVRNKVYFASNQSTLNGNAEEILAAQASWLIQHPKYSKITIEGHCDERGTREYNIALGERRATAAKRELVKCGLSGNNISIITYGKERPDVLGSTESAWSLNRRAVTVIQES